MVHLCRTISSHQFRRRSWKANPEKLTGSGQRWCGVANRNSLLLFHIASSNLWSQSLRHQELKPFCPPLQNRSHLWTWEWTRLTLTQREKNWPLFGRGRSSLLFPKEVNGEHWQVCKGEHWQVCNNWYHFTDLVTVPTGASTLGKLEILSKFRYE